jgi:deoxycytidylate deaminase
MRHLEKLEVFTSLAERLATLSTCKRYSVGCVIVPEDLTSVYAIGYNGPPSGEPNDSCLGVTGGCGCLHAEANAMTKLGQVRDALLICTVAPCWQCAGLILNSKKIGRVKYVHEYRDASGLNLLRRHLSAETVERWAADRVE